MKLPVHSWEMTQANLRRLDSHLASSSSFLSSASWMNCSAHDVQLFLLAQGWAVQALHHRFLLRGSSELQVVMGSLRKTRSATTIETHCRGYRIPEESRYLVVGENMNMCIGPRIYSARESNMPIVEELRMDVPGSGNV